MDGLGSEGVVRAETGAVGSEVLAVPEWTVVFALTGEVTVDADDEEAAIQRAGNLDLGEHITGTSLIAVEREG